jgi:nucleoside-diphosphate-sugar epimerase
MARGQETVIFGDGHQQRDFVYVGDIVAALLATVGKNGGPYNIGTGIPTDVNELHAACRRAAGIAEEPVHREARLGDVIRSVIDPALAARELGWRAEVSLDDGIARTWAWTKEAAAQ